jgi:hypothetical protein
MSRSKRANGAGMIFIKHGGYYGRWVTPTGGRTNRKIGPARRPGTAAGMTRSQAEKRLREMIGAIQVTTDPDHTVAVAGRALLDRLEARSSARSHIETVESTPARPHRPVLRRPPAGPDRGGAHHSIRRPSPSVGPGAQDGAERGEHAALGVRARATTPLDHHQPCTLVDLPATKPSTDIRFLRQEELAAVLDTGIPDDEWGFLERPLYLMAAMTGLRRGELLALRWQGLDIAALKVRVRQAFATPGAAFVEAASYVCGSRKSRRWPDDGCGAFADDGSVRSTSTGAHAEALTPARRGQSRGNERRRQS